MGSYLQLSSNPWLATGLGALAAVVAGLALHGIFLPIVRRLLAFSVHASTVVQYIARPTRFLLLLFGLQLVCSRRLQTHAHVLARVVMMIVLIIGIACALMLFPSIREVGAGLLASAGIAGIAAGVAALAPLRAELERLCKEAPDWDGRLAQLQVVDASERAMQIRALVSAIDSGKAWDLRCCVREGLIAHLQREYPEAYGDFAPTSSGTVRHQSREQLADRQIIEPRGAGEEDLDTLGLTHRKVTIDGGLKSHRDPRNLLRAFAVGEPSDELGAERRTQRAADELRDFQVDRRRRARALAAHCLARMPHGTTHRVRQDPIPARPPSRLLGVGRHSTVYGHITQSRDDLSLRGAELRRGHGRGG